MRLKLKPGYKWRTGLRSMACMVPTKGKSGPPYCWGFSVVTGPKKDEARCGKHLSPALVIPSYRELSTMFAGQLRELEAEMTAGFTDKKARAEGLRRLRDLRRILRP